MSAKRQNNQSKAKKTALPSSGKARVLCSYNNTIISITDDRGNVLVQSSGGGKGRAKGSRKGLAHAAKEAAIEAGTTAKSRGMQSLAVILKGGGNGRDACVQGLVASGMEISHIVEATGDPHGGCRRRKRKRV